MNPSLGGFGLGIHASHDPESTSPVRTRAESALAFMNVLLAEPGESWSENSPAFLRHRDLMRSMPQARHAAEHVRGRPRAVRAGGAGGGLFRIVRGRDAEPEAPQGRVHGRS